MKVSSKIFVSFARSKFSVLKFKYDVSKFTSKI